MAVVAVEAVTRSRQCRLVPSDRTAAIVTPMINRSVAHLDAGAKGAPTAGRTRAHLTKYCQGAGFTYALTS
jgi:hypothetical protein